MLDGWNRMRNKPWNSTTEYSFKQDLLLTGERRIRTSLIYQHKYDETEKLSRLCDELSMVVHPILQTRLATILKQLPSDTMTTAI